MSLLRLRMTATLNNPDLPLTMATSIVATIAVLLRRYCCSLMNSDQDSTITNNIAPPKKNALKLSHKKPEWIHHKHQHHHCQLQGLHQKLGLQQPLEEQEALRPQSNKTKTNS